MNQRGWVLALLLVLVTGCPHNWRKGRAMDMAMKKDLEEEWRLLRQRMNCQLTKEDWDRFCIPDDDGIVPELCPSACRPDDDLTR